MSQIDITKLLLANFSGSKQAEEQAKGLRLGFQTHYQLARLAIGRSLGEFGFPPPAPDARGKIIKGNQLFGNTGEELLWLGLLVTNLKQHLPKAEPTLEAVQSLVRDHWHRGVALLLDDWREAEGHAGDPYKKFIEILITRRALLPQEGGNGDDGPATDWTGKKGPVWLTLGQLTEEQREARWLVNGQGYAPNIALMGQAGSGKTRCMLTLLEQAQAQSSAPVILLDLGKGELADNTELARRLNADVLRVPEQAIPLDMFQRIEETDNAAHVLQAFRDSFERAMSTKAGPKQLDSFREALKPLFTQGNRIKPGLAFRAVFPYRRCPSPP